MSAGRGVPPARSFHGQLRGQAGGPGRLRPPAGPGGWPRKRIRDGRAKPNSGVPGEVSPPQPPAFPRLLSPHLHLSSTPASGRRPRHAPPTTHPAPEWQSFSLGPNPPPPPRRRFPQSQSGRSLHPWPQAPPTPGLRMAEPRRGGRTGDSQWGPGRGGAPERAAVAARSRQAAPESWSQPRGTF